MANQEHFYCEKDNHWVTMNLSKKALEITIKKCKKGKLICPHCHPENVKLVHYECETDKLYTCEDSHLIAYGMFTNGYINMCWGQEEDEFKNIKVSPDELKKQIENETIKCPRCDKKLYEIDDSEFRLPHLPNTKTKVYVGDIWDKAKCPEARESTYDKDGNFQASEFDKANQRRMEDMRRGKISFFDDATGKQKTIRRQRVNKPIGQPMTRPTKPNE
jgi:hypothetical protein